MKESKRNVYKFKVYGKEYELASPTVRQVHQFNKKAKEEGVDDVELSIAFINELGLPEDEAWEMETAHLKEIIDTVIGQKKS